MDFIVSPMKLHNSVKFYTTFSWLVENLSSISFSQFILSVPTTYAYNVLKHVLGRILLSQFTLLPTPYAKGHRFLKVQ